MNHTEDEVVQKIIDTVYEKLDGEMTVEDIDWAAMTMLRVKEHRGSKEIIKGNHF